MCGGSTASRSGRPIGFGPMEVSSARSNKDCPAEIPGCEIFNERSIRRLGPLAGTTTLTICRTVQPYEERMGFLPDADICPECPYHYRNAKSQTA